MKDALITSIAAMALAGGGSARPIDNLIQKNLLEGAHNVKVSDCKKTAKKQNRLPVYRCRFHSPDNFINEIRCFAVEGQIVSQS